MADLDFDTRPTRRQQTASEPIGTWLSRFSATCAGTLLAHVLFVLLVFALIRLYVEAKIAQIENAVKRPEPQRVIDRPSGR